MNCLNCNIPIKGVFLSYHLIQIIILISSFILSNDSDDNINLTSFTFNIISTVLQIILCKDILIGISFVVEFFLGLICLINFQNVNLFHKIINILNLIPCLSIWLFISGVYIYFAMLKTQEAKKIYNQNKNKIKFKILEKEYQCSICFDNINKNGYTICNNSHYFHKECISKWVEYKYDAKCPYCRE